MSKGWHRLWIGVVVFLFSSLPYTGSSFGLTTEEEKKLGREFLSEVKKRFELVEEPCPLSFLHELVELLYLNEANRPFDVSVYLLKRAELNAFAGPGGNLFLFTGLLEQLEDLDELASVLSHELAHISFRHLSNRIRQSYKAGLATLGGMLLGALLGGAPGEAIIAGSMAAGAQMQLAYSREDERQADQLGVKYMVDAGFDPQAVIALHKRLQNLTYFAGNKVPPYLLTHPTGAERMANLDSMIGDVRSFKRGKKAEELKELYPLIRAVVMAGTKDTEDVIPFFEEMKKRFPKRPEYPLGLGIARLRDRDVEISKKEFSLAMNLAPNLGIPKIYMAKAFLEASQPDKAEAYLKEALDQNDKDVLANYLMAEALLDQGKDGDAMVYLKRLTYLETKVHFVNPDIYYKMGNILGRQGKTDLAHYNLALFYLKSGELSKVSFHLSKALSLTHDERLKAQIKELEKELKERKPPS